MAGHLPESSSEMVGELLLVILVVGLGISLIVLPENYGWIALITVLVGFPILVLIHLHVELS